MFRKVCLKERAFPIKIKKRKGEGKKKEKEKFIFVPSILIV
jgi:hypothetical protein